MVRIQDQIVYLREILHTNEHLTREQAIALSWVIDRTLNKTHKSNTKRNHRI